MRSTTPRTTSRTRTGPTSRSTPPVRTRARSSTSSSRACMWRPAVRMRSTPSRWSCFSSSSSRSWANPSTAFSGVRSSWPSRATNSSRALSSRSALSRRRLSVRLRRIRWNPELASSRTRRAVNTSEWPVSSVNFTGPRQQPARVSAGGTASRTCWAALGAMQSSSVSQESPRSTRPATRSIPSTLPPVSRPWASKSSTASPSKSKTSPRTAQMLGVSGSSRRCGSRWWRRSRLGRAQRGRARVFDRESPRGNTYGAL